MSDDGDPWGTGEDDTAAAVEPAAAEPAVASAKGSKAGTPGAKTPAAAATPAKVATPAKEATPVAASTVPSPGQATPIKALPEGEVPAQDDIHIRRPLVLYKHWVRPQFLQYKYMYDYRTNYYDDVIDYLDKRSRGVKTEVPRAQYWAERVLRTHKNLAVKCKAEKKEDKHLIQTIAATIRTHNYHSTAYINRKYATIL